MIKQISPEAFVLVVADKKISQDEVQFLKKSGTNLIFLCIDQGGVASYSQGKELLEDCKNLAKKLLANLVCVENPWTVINSSSIVKSGSAERSTSVAVMAGVLAIKIKRVSEDDVVLAALLCDIGLIDMPPKTLKKYR